MEEINFIEELKKLKEEFNVRIDRLLTSIESKSSASVLNESTQDKVDENRIPDEYKLNQNQLNELRIFLGPEMKPKNLNHNVQINRSSKDNKY